MNSSDESTYRCRYFCKGIILRILKTPIMPVLLYRSEPLMLSHALESSINAFYNRSIYLHNPGARTIAMRASACRRLIVILRS